MQSYAHHIVAIVTFSMALLLNNQGGYLTAAVANQHTEISTPFLHARQFLFIHTSIPFHGFLKALNGAVFFIIFLFGRFVFQLRLTWVFFSWLATDVQTKWDTPLYGNFEKFMVPFCIVCQIAMILLNSYWLQLILKQIIRNFCGKSKGGKDIQEEVQDDDVREQLKNSKKKESKKTK